MPPAEEAIAAKAAQAHAAQLSGALAQTQQTHGNCNKGLTLQLVKCNGLRLKLMMRFSIPWWKLTAGILNGSTIWLWNWVNGSVFWWPKLR